jgi:hypothetical protein
LNVTVRRKVRAQGNDERLPAYAPAIYRGASSTSS